MDKKNDIIRFDEIAEVFRAGWNLGNSLEANSGGTPDETVWGNAVVTQELITAVAEAGFRTVRIPVSYLDKINDSDSFKIEAEWLNRLNEVVDYCINEKLNVIINIHGDGYYTVEGSWLLCGEADQDSICKKFRAVWKQIAEKFCDYDEHLVFESMNEVFDNTYSEPKSEMYENINEYNRIFVDTVRKTGGNNSHRWLLIPGWNTNIDYTVGDHGFHMPEDRENTAGENRLMVSVHFYDPWDYCGKESKKIFLWGKRGQEIVEINKASPKNKASLGDEAYIEKQILKLKEKYIDNKIPVIVGEYGCIDKTHANSGIPNQIAENRAYWNGFTAGICAQNGIVPVYWDNGWNGQYGFGLFDRTTAVQTQPEIIETIIKAVDQKAPDIGMETRIDQDNTAQTTSDALYPCEHALN